MPRKLKFFQYDLKPNNIMEAYILAVRSSEMNPSRKLRAFLDVIEFCERDAVCFREDSIKRNTLLFWAYDQAALAEVRSKRYKEALSFWLKSFAISVSPQARIRLGGKMLSIVNKGKLSVFDKANNLVKIADYMHQAYLEMGQHEEAERMKRLQQVSAYVLQRPHFNA